MQEYPSGLRPIAYSSHTLPATIKSLPPYDQELSAVCKALDQWAHYLEG